MLRDLPCRSTSTTEVAHKGADRPPGNPAQGYSDVHLTSKWTRTTVTPGT